MPAPWSPARLIFDSLSTFLGRCLGQMETCGMSGMPMPFRQLACFLSFSLIPRSLFRARWGLARCLACNCFSPNSEQTVSADLCPLSLCASSIAQGVHGQVVYELLCRSLPCQLRVSAAGILSFGPSSHTVQEAPLQIEPGKKLMICLSH